jgi:hypothetical protein
MGGSGSAIWEARPMAVRRSSSTPSTYACILRSDVLAVAATALSTARSTARSTAEVTDAFTVETMSVDLGLELVVRGRHHLVDGFPFQRQGLHQLVPALFRRRA